MGRYPIRFIPHIPHLIENLRAPTAMTKPREM